MNVLFINGMSYLEPILCAVVLLAILRARETKSFSTLTMLLGLRLSADLLCLGIIQVSGTFIDRHLGYDIYFYTYWISFAADSLLSLYVILGIFKLAMAPLKGLQSLGMLVFRWAAAISVALAVAIGSNSHASGAKFLVAIVTQLQQISSVLTLCLLLFVCFAIRPLGLSFRSRIFGVSAGLGLTSTMNLVSAAWLAHSVDMLSSVLSIASNAIGLITLLVWSIYFALPEPKRRIIVLPTTSPFLRWNQISEVLGDEPGFVAIAGIPPEVFAPAELEIMARASAQMTPPPMLAEFDPNAAPITLQTLIA